MYLSQQQGNLQKSVIYNYTRCLSGVYCLVTVYCQSVRFVLYNLRGQRSKFNGRSYMNRKEETEFPTDMRLLNIRQVSNILGLSYNGTYNLINTRRIKSVTIGTRRLFTIKAVQEYIQSLEESYEA